MEHQLDATITVFLIDLQDRLKMFRASFCPSSGALLTMGKNLPETF
jgi:hypothetical protein